jgi:hypothetical protein
MWSMDWHVLQSITCSRVASPLRTAGGGFDMEHEPGDDYIRRTAAFIRTHERNLAEAGLPVRRRHSLGQKPASVLNPLAWFGTESAQSTTAAKPLVFSLDVHRLFYILMRLEAFGIDIGTLDVTVDSPSRPMSYINLPDSNDKSDAHSLSSFRTSLSAVSNLSLGGGWWSRPEPPSVDSDLKFIYSCFTKLPALSIAAPGRKSIKELEYEPPNQNALPLDAFKSLKSLECLDVDPRALLGWDKVAVSLRSLTIKRSGMEDVSDLFIGAVIDDQARREGSTSRRRRRRIPHGPSRRTSFYSTVLPDSVPEDADESLTLTDHTSQPLSRSRSPSPGIKLSSFTWASLKHLSLSDNHLTFFPISPLPYLSSLTHLDLSSNLLVSVPPGLSALYNLTSLNLSDNMIDSVLGIYTNIGQILAFNMSRNRLESICGLERLLALERVDLRHNLIDDSAEIGRLATLPHIADIWIEGNPFVEYEEGYRVTCFDYFWKEGRSVTLDGSQPGFYERRNLTSLPPPQMSSSRPMSKPHSPPVVPVTSVKQSPVLEGQTAGDRGPEEGKASPKIAGVVPAGKGRRKKAKRIVELDIRVDSDGHSAGRAHARYHSEDLKKVMSPVQEQPTLKGVVPMHPSSRPILAKTNPMSKTRHGRHQSEFISTSIGAPTSLSSEQGTSSPSPSSSPTTNDPTAEPPFPPPLSTTHRASRTPQTFSSRSAVRRARMSTSVFETQDAGTGNDGGVEEYRKRIEALRSDMGDGWLKAFSQSQLDGVPG